MNFGLKLPLCFFFFKVTAKAGTRIIFPPDVMDKRLSVKRIATNRVPMTLEDGRSTNLYISVQPSGAVFETPVEISYPNLDGLAPNESTLLMSFDHDAGRYVQVGTGMVSADGRIVRSDAGSGIRVGAWHAAPPRATPPDAPAPEATVLSFVQVEGNPAFEDKDVEVTEASVLGARVIPYNEETNAEGILSKILLRGVVSFPRNSPPQTSKVLAFTDSSGPKLQFGGGVFTPNNQDIFLAENKDVTLPVSITDRVPGNTYTVECSKPDADRAIVTACTDTAITIKGGPDSFKHAGETKFKVKLSSTGNGKDQAEIRVNLVRVKYKEDKAKSGFDNLVKGQIQKPLFDPAGNYIGDGFEDDPDNDINAKKDPWLTVVLGGDQNAPSIGEVNTAKYEITPSKAANFIEFVGNDPTNNKLTVSNDTNVKKVSVTGKSLPAGQVAEDLQVDAKLKNTFGTTVGMEVGKLNVVVRLRVKVRVAFYYLRDVDARGNPDHKSSGDPSNLDDFITKINEILTPQTGVQYMKTSVYHWDTSKNFPAGNTSALAQLPKPYGPVVSLGANSGVLSEWRTLSSGDPATAPSPRQPKLCDANADREVYFVWEAEIGDTLPVINGIAQSSVRAAFNGGSAITTIISETTSDFEAVTHEIGHSLKISPKQSKYYYLDYPLPVATPSPSPSATPTPRPTPSPDSTHSNVKLELMYSTTTGKWRIPKEDVDQAISTLGVVLWKTGGVRKRAC